MTLEPDPMKTTYSALLEFAGLTGEGGIELVTFGGVNENYHYNGSPATAALSFNKEIWESAGKPMKILVTLSQVAE